MYVADTLHGVHSGSVPASMLAVFKVAKTLISANMYGMHSTCVVHRFLKQKIVVSTQEKSFGMKCMHQHTSIQQYVAEIMHRMQSGSVPTSMLAVFKLVKTLISANMYGMYGTCVVHRFHKTGKCTRTKLWDEKYALGHVYINVCC